MKNKHWQSLKAGDTVEIIAPSGRAEDASLAKVKRLLKAWKLNCLIARDIFGKDLLCANSDSARFEHLQHALHNKNSQAIWCLRGGYGATRLLSRLVKMQQPKQTKLFIGLSDITALHIFLQQQWRWSTIHGPQAQQSVMGNVVANSVEQLRALMFGEVLEQDFVLIPLNKAAKKSTKLRGSVTGGNLSLIQASLGTFWQLNGKGKIILLEEVNERGYRVDRMLEQLKQADIFKNATAVLLGDFIGGQEADGNTNVPGVLQRFSEEMSIPVLQCAGIGHGEVSMPIALGTAAQLTLGRRCLLSCQSGAQ